MLSIGTVLQAVEDTERWAVVILVIAKMKKKTCVSEYIKCMIESYAEHERWRNRKTRLMAIVEYSRS